MTDAPASLLAVIVARGGSKTLPRKNVLPLGGRPLIGWSIKAALDAPSVTRVIVSTDDPEIAAVARTEGADVPFMRPDHLATDRATSIDVLTHALENLPGYDAAVLLQPTSPFRTTGDIEAGFALFQSSGAPSCTSVCPVEESPYLMYHLDPTSRLQRVVPIPSGGLRRQDLPQVAILNGALYFIGVDRFLRDQTLVHEDAVGYLMPRSRSIDIDDARDLKIASETLDDWGGMIPDHDIRAGQSTP
jgi:CMP-N,N'-diacetyllegionaminic acid synthase